MRKTIIHSILRTLLLLIVISGSHCMAWPGATMLLTSLTQSGGSSPVFFPPPSSSQPQDNPRPADDLGGVLTPETAEIPITPALEIAELLVSTRTGLQVSESGTSVTVDLRLSEQPSESVRVRNFTLSHTGEIQLSSTDFTFTTTNWNTPQIMTITGLADSIQDGDKEVVISLGNLESIDSRFNNLDGGEIRVLNTDVDSAGIALTPLSGIVTSESGDSSILTVALNARPTDTVTIPVVISSGEAIASPASLTFTPMNWNNPQTVTITGVDDSLQDGNQSYTIQMGPATSSDPIYNGMESSLANATNLDNDTASVVVNTSAALPYTTNEDGQALTYRVRLSSQPTHSVTIPVLSLAPTEGQPNTASLIFTTLNWNTEQNVIITGINDNAIDGDALYTIRFDSPVSDDTNYSSLHAQDISITNLDNDTAGLEFRNHLSLTTGEDGTNRNFQFRLRSQPTANVTVSLESSDLTEGTLNHASMTFTPVNWNSWRTVTISGQNDSLIDGDVWYEVRFPTITSADSDYNGISVSALPVVSLDDDTPGVMFLGASSLTTRENSAALTNFQVRLRTRPTENVRFPLVQSNNLNEGIVTTTELVFTPANWNVPQTISVQSVRDFVVDGNISYNIDFTPLESLDPLYSNFTVPSVPVTNNNSDTFGYVFAPAFNSINLHVSDTGIRDGFTLRLNSRPTGTVSIPLSTTDPTRAGVSPALIEFTPDNWDTPVPVEVFGIFVTETNPPPTMLIGLRLGVYNPGDRRNYPEGTSDYSTFAFGDRNGNGSDNGILNIVRFSTDRPISVIHPLIRRRISTRENGTEVPLQIQLGSEPTSPVTIRFTSSRPDEGLPIPGEITIQPADWEDLHTVIIQGQNDNFVDGNQNYSIQFESISLDSTFNGYAIPNANFRNIDTNNNRFAISPGNNSNNPFITTRSAGPRNTYTFRLRLNGMPNGTVTVPLQSNNLTEGTLDKTELVFNSGNWNVFQEVTIQAVDNGSTSISNYTITAGPSTADPGLDAVFNGGTYSLTIHVRNTSPGFTLSSASGNTGEWGSRASFNFRLNSPPTANVTCYYYIDRETEARGISGPVTTGFAIPNEVRRFTRSSTNWNSNTRITVEGVDDEVIDGDQTYRVVFLPCSSTDTDYDGLVPPSVSFRNEDND